MDKMPLALTIDFGTQSVRALIFNKSGETLAIEKYVYQPAYFSKAPGQCEQNADFYYEHMCEVTKNLTQKHPDLMKQVVGCAITCFRDTAVFLDENYQPIRPCILWCDQRLAKCETPLPLLNRFLFWLVGMKETVVMNRKRTMVNWVRENEPETIQKTKHYFALSTCFLYRLTGETKDSASNYTGHYPIDMKKKKWFKKSALKYPIFATPEEWLPTLIESGELIGTISKKCAEESGLPEGLKVYANGTDKGSETIGTGCLRKDMASISYGTASTIEVSNKKYIEPEPFLPSYPACIPNLYNMEVQIYRGYWMVTWFVREFANQEAKEAAIQSMAVEEVLNERLMEIPPGSQGLVLQPYWGPGLSRPEAKGAIVGFSDYHTRIHIYRAIIEGIAYGLREALEGIEKRQHKKVKEIRVSGGGSQSDAICQITADIFGLPVSRVQTYETASLGTAILVFTAAHEFNTFEEAVENMVHTSTTFMPNIEAHRQYDYLYKHVYEKMYPRLKSVYKSVRKYNRKYE